MRNIFNGCAYFCFGLLPLCTAKLMEFDSAILTRADIFCDKIELCYGNIENILLCVFYLDVIFGYALGFYLVYAVKNAYSVYGMNYIVTD